MPIIYRAETVRLSIAEAKRLILDALPSEKFGQVIARTTPDGEIDWSGPLELRESHGKPQKDFIDEEFKEICQSLAIQPLMRWRPSVSEYPTSSSLDDEYTITHDEFSEIANRYGLLVEVGSVTQMPQSQVASSPQVEQKETPKERRARWLVMFEEEERRGERGALQRLADKEGVDRSNMKKAINKATEERNGQKRDGLWGQLVKDGKRQV